MIRAYYNEFDPKSAAWLRQLIKNGNITPGVVDERSITEVKPDDLNGFDRVHFFAGIGTWDYCLNGSGWADRPIWTASLPCQPFSTAGKGLGKADERHLLPHFLELVRECRPATIIGEQVAAAIGHGWLDDLYAEMEACDYAIGSAVIGAHSIGAPHIRQRLYWVANSASERGCGRESLGEGRYSESGRPSDDIRMANSNNEGSQRRARAERTDQQLVGKNGVVDGMVYSNESGSQQRIETAEAARHRDTAESTGSINGLANTNTTGKTEQGHRQLLEERLSDGFVGSCEDGVEWIYCRDNKYRPIKPGIFKMAHGLTAGMVCSCNTSIETIKFEKEGEINASEHKTDAGKILPSLLCKDGTEQGERGVRGSESFQKKEVLQSYVHGQCLRGRNESYKFKKRAQTVSEESEGMLRGVFKDNHLTCSSCGRKSFEQQSIEFDDIVLGMSQGSTLTKLFCTKGTEYLQALRKTGDEERSLLDTQYSLSEVWESIDDEEKNRVRVHFNRGAWVIDEGIRPLVDGVARGMVHGCDPSEPINANATQEARAMRLKGYGNAIQAQTAIAFITAFMGA